MKNFHGKRDSGGHSFDRGNRGFGGRDSGRPAMMHKATCSQCGKDCQLPFKPNGNRAVFCSTCFEGQKNENPDRAERKSFGKPAFRTDKPRFEDKKVFEAVCGNCGDDCLVPFRPFPGKPVFCKKCFDRDDKSVNHIVKTDNASNKAIEQLKTQIEMLDIKLERILRMLTPEEDRIEAEETGIKPVKKTASKKSTKKTK